MSSDPAGAAGGERLSLSGRFNTSQVSWTGGLRNPKLKANGIDAVPLQTQIAERGQRTGWRPASPKKQRPDVPSLAATQMIDTARLSAAAKGGRIGGSSIDGPLWAAGGALAGPGGGRQAVATARRSRSALPAVPSQRSSGGRGRSGSSGRSGRSGGRGGGKSGGGKSNGNKGRKAAAAAAAAAAAGGAGGNSNNNNDNNKALTLSLRPPPEGSAAGVAAELGGDGSSSALVGVADAAAASEGALVVRRGQARLADLCDEDKSKVAKLIQQLVKVRACVPA